MTSLVQPDTQQLGFHLENGSAQLGVRRLDVGHQAAFKAGLPGAIPDS